MTLSPCRGRGGHGLLRAHTWEDLGGAGEGRGGQHRWFCRQCGAEELSYDEPWATEGVQRVYVSAIECGGGPANVSTLADCDVEFVRRIMMS